MIVSWSGLGITNAKGLLGGNVLSGNAAGRMASIYRRPITRHVPSQNLQRNRFQTIVAGWKALSPSTQAGWNAEAATGDWNEFNSIGVEIQYSGFQLFVKLNLTLATVETSITTAPSKPTLSPPLLTSVDADVGTYFKLTFSPGTINSGEHVVIYATRLLSPGIFSPRHSEYIFVQAVDSGSFSTSVDIEANWESRFGNLVEGYAIFVKATLIGGTTGDTAPCGTARNIVTT